jgi:hypothetical protein
MPTDCKRVATKTKIGRRSEKNGDKSALASLTGEA